MIVGYSVNLRNRRRDHFTKLSKGVHGNRYLQSAYNKYGKKSFKFEVIEECQERFLCSLEHYWATILNTHNRKIGYNILPTDPRAINYKPSKETIERLVKRMTGSKKGPRSEETKRRISKSLMGYKMTPERLKKHTEVRKGLFLGRKLSDEVKRNMSIAKSGANNPNFGKIPWNKKIA